MRRVATNLYIDDRGKYHARVRVQIEVGGDGKKKPVLRKKTLAAENLSDAEVELVEFEAGLRAPKIIRFQVESHVLGASDSGVVAALQQTIAILEGRIGSLAKQNDELMKLLQGMSNSKSGEPGEFASRPDFPECLEQFVETIRSTVGGKTLRMWERNAKVLLTHCTTWEKFDPATIWGERRKQLRSLHVKIRAANGLEGEVPQIAGGTSLNHLRSFLRKFASWRIEKKWAAESEFSCLRRLKMMNVESEKVNIPPVEDLAVFFDRAKSVDLKLGRFLHLTFLLGCRKMTTIALRWEDCDLEKATANLLVKGQRREEVNLLRETVALLKEMRPPGTTTGLVIRLNDTEYKRALRLVKTVIASMGLQGSKIKSIKSLRNMMASTLMEIGFSAPEAAKMLCHQDEGILLQRTYAKVRIGHLKGKVNATSILGIPPQSPSEIG